MQIIDRYFQDLRDKEDDNKAIRDSVISYLAYLVLLCLSALFFSQTNNIFALPFYLFTYYYLGGEMGKFIFKTYESVEQKKKRVSKLQTKRQQAMMAARRFYRINTRTQINQSLINLGNEFSLSVINFDAEYELAQIEAIENLK